MKLEYAAMEPSKSTSAECSGEVRWSAHGTLQQRWTIREYVGGSLSGYRTEWREVLTETPTT